MRSYKDARLELLGKYPTNTPNLLVAARESDCPTAILKVGDIDSPIYKLRINVVKRNDGKCFEVREYSTCIGYMFEHAIEKHFETLDKAISYAYEVAGDFNSLYKKYNEI